MTSTEHDIGAAEEFQGGKPYRRTVGGRAFVVVRKGEEFFALRDGCPHAGASLAGGCVVGTPLPCAPGEEAGYAREGEIVTCPWHGWAFDLKNGQSLVRPEKYRVKTYPVAVRDGRVYIVSSVVT